MTKPSDRRKKKKFVKTTKETKKVFLHNRPNVHECSYCGKKMHGMPHHCNENNTKKLSKTKRRPSGMFSGTLCGQCKQHVWQESAKVYSGIKPLESVDLKLKSLVQQALPKTGI